MVVQGDPLNRSRIATAVCIPLTSSLRRAEARGNILLTAKATGLPKDSVPNVSQLVTLERSLLERPFGKVSRKQLDSVLIGIDIVLDRRR